jgi:hypothetical protein
LLILSGKNRIIPAAAKMINNDKNTLIHENPELCFGVSLVLQCRKILNFINDFGVIKIGVWKSSGRDR